MIRRRSGARRGATLPEVLTVSALFVLILVVVVNLGVTSANEWSADSSQIAADNDASLALQALAQEARNGLRASVDTAGKVLTVVMPAVNNQGDYDRSAEGDTIRYYFLKNALVRQRGTGTPTTLGKSISAVGFTMNGSQVEVSVTARMQMGTKTKTTQLVSQFTLRNVP